MNTAPSHHDSLRYFERALGRPYQYDDFWLGRFNAMAEGIARRIQPGTVLDVNSGIGLLVNCLRGRGVEAWGIEASEAALQGVPPDIRPYCRAGSVLESLPQRYDLIICIEALENLPPQEMQAAVENICRYSDDILFSSTPFADREMEHLNLQPPGYWAELFAGFHYFHDIDFDASFITPWAVRFRKAQLPRHRLVSAYESRLWHLEQENRSRREFSIEQQLALGAKDSSIQALHTQVEHVQAQISQAKEQLNALEELNQKLEELNRKNEGIIQGLTDQVAKNAVLIQELTDRIAENDSLIQELTDRVAEKNILIQSQNRIIMDKDAYAQNIINSRSWRFMLRVQRVRRFFIPEGSHRERLLFTFFLAVSIGRREGLRALYHRAAHKISYAVKSSWGTLRYRARRAHTSESLDVPTINIPQELQSHQSTVDIVICVHNALSDLQKCLVAILQHTSPPYSIILVDDGSGPDTASFLSSFSLEHGCTLLRNEEARGYTLAANQGLCQSAADFVVLLNSDTIVAPEWLDRMLACCQSDPKIGIVSPLSNTASWQSIPEIASNGDWALNPLPPGISIEEMGTLVAQYSARVYPSMPLLNGFCLLFRDQVIKEVGYFDEETFGKGYGEENDYCLRARKAGWKLALADDTYIFHAQSKSYSNEKRKLLSEQAGIKLARKHGYPIINASVAYCRENRVLEGIRARSRVLSERTKLVEAGQARFEHRRLAFILPSRDVGGGTNIILTEARAIQRMGVDVSVINLPSNRYDFEQAYPGLNIPVEYIEIENIPNAAQRFDAVIATFNPSVDWLFPAVQKNGKLVIGYYIQDFEPLFYPPESPEYQRAWSSYSRIPNMIRFTKTEWTKEAVQNNVGVSCQVIGSDFDCDLFLPRPRQDPEWPDRPLRIGAMIRPSSPRRGPAITMDVLREIDRQYKGQADIRLFGTLPNDPGFLALNRDFSWRLAGVLNPLQAASFLNELDVFVDFSSYQAMGLTSLEAMACGAAVIIPAHGGAAAFARSDENCLVIDTSDKKHCVQALRQLIDDHSLRSKLQKNSIHQVSQYYPELPAYNLLSLLFPSVG